MSLALRLPSCQNFISSSLARAINKPWEVTHRNILAPLVSSDLLLASLLTGSNHVGHIGQDQGEENSDQDDDAQYTRGLGSRPGIWSTDFAPNGG